MARQLKIPVSKLGIVADEDRVLYFAAIAGRLLAAATVVLVIALPLATELRLTSEPRATLLEATTSHGSP